MTKKVIKKEVMLLILALLLIVCVGCQKDVQAPSDTIPKEDYEKLPEDQQDSELDKELAEVRRQKKEGAKKGLAPSGIGIPGYSKVPNDFSTEELENIFETIYVYLEKKGIDTKENATIGGCYDPRMIKIYEDKNKGVAKGYQNKDIFVAEYETKVTGVYSYLIVARDKKGTWKVLYDGTSYKE